MGFTRQFPSTPNVTRDHAYKIGANYFIRAVTMAHTGKLVAVTDGELVLENAAWIADTGRFADFLKTGKANEVEPFPDGEIIVSRGGVIDAVEITFPLPRIQK